MERVLMRNANLEAQLKTANNRLRYAIKLLMAEREANRRILDALGVSSVDEAVAEIERRNKVLAAAEAHVTSLGAWRRMTMEIEGNGDLYDDTCELLAEHSVHAHDALIEAVRELREQREAVADTSFISKAEVGK